MLADVSACGVVRLHNVGVLGDAVLVVLERECVDCCLSVANRKVLGAIRGITAADANVIGLEARDLQLDSISLQGSISAMRCSLSQRPANQYNAMQ